MTNLLFSILTDEESRSAEKVTELALREAVNLAPWLPAGT